MRIYTCTIRVCDEQKAHRQGKWKARGRDRRPTRWLNSWHEVVTWDYHIAPQLGASLHRVSSTREDLATGETYKRNPPLYRDTTSRLRRSRVARNTLRLAALKRSKKNTSRLPTGDEASWCRIEFRAHILHVYRRELTWIRATRIWQAQLNCKREDWKLII